MGRSGATDPHFDAQTGEALHRESRMTPNGDWVWRWVGEWHFDADATEGRSIAENDAMQAEHAT